MSRHSLPRHRRLSFRLNSRLRVKVERVKAKVTEKASTKMVSTNPKGMKAKTERVKVKAKVKRVKVKVKAKVKRVKVKVKAKTETRKATLMSRRLGPFLPGRRRRPLGLFLRSKT